MLNGPAFIKIALHDRRSGIAGALLSSIAGLLLAQSSFAQELPSLIVEANSSNNQINVLTFDAATASGTATQFNTTTANQNTEIRALGFRAGGIDLVVADRIGKIEIFRNISEPPVTVCDANDATPDDCPSTPDGIANAADFMVVVDSAPSVSMPARIWSLGICDFSICPGGFNVAQIVDDNVCIGNEDGSGVCSGARARLLAETELVRGAFSFNDSADTGVIGDVLILVEDPAALLILSSCALITGTGACPAAQPRVVISTSEFGGTTPTGITWIQGTPFVLIANADGVIQRFRFDNAGAVVIPTAFDDDAGKGTLKIKSGTDSDGNVIAVLNRLNHGDSFLYQVGFGPSGPFAIGGQAVAVITRGIESPNGLALANVGGIDDTSDCELSPDGCAPAGILQHFFPTGTGNLGFLIESVTHVLSDPRLPDCNTDLAASNFDPILPSDVIIPSFLCGLTDLYFITANLENPVPDGVVLTDAFESLLEGPVLDCYPGGAGAPLLEQQLVQFWAPFGTETDIVESPFGIETTVGCINPSRGGSNSLSLFVVGLSYVEGTDMVAQAADKLGSLQATVTDSACNSGMLCKKARNAIKNAIRKWGKGNVTKTLNALADLRSIVVGNSQLFNGSTGENFAGNITARIDNFVFTYNSKIEPYGLP